MRGRHVLIPGGTDGLGKATAVELAKRGASVIVAGRSPGRGERAASEVRAAGGSGEVVYLRADVAEMASVRDLAAEYRSLFPKLDVLIHCAGTISMKRRLTGEGIESNFATNYLGRFLLTELLKDLMPDRDRSRVVIVGTAGVQPIRFDFASLPACCGLSMFRAYQQSQAANDVWGLDLAHRFAPRGIAVNVVAPGVVKTNIRRHAGANWMLRLFDLLSAPFALSVETGIITLVQLASDSDTQYQTGTFLGVRSKILKIPDKARSAVVQQELRRISQRLAGLAPDVHHRGGQ